MRLMNVLRPHKRKLSTFGKLFAIFFFSPAEGYLTPSSEELAAKESELEELNRSLENLRSEMVNWEAGKRALAERLSEAESVAASLQTEKEQLTTAIAQQR